jgi:hypothetical protein
MSHAADSSGLRSHRQRPEGASPARRRGALWLVCFVPVPAIAVLLAGELVARRIVPGGTAEAARERREFLLKLPGEGGVDARADSALSSVYVAQGKGMQIHPFFGYTFRRGAGGANNHGFFSNVGDFPYRKGPRELVIGMLGGSVALQSCGNQRTLTEPLERELARKGYERVTLLCLAVGGWRQPQSFIALAYFLPMIDVAIVLDGFNEVIQTSEGVLRSYPAAFPWSAVYAPLARGAGSADETLRLAGLVEANREAARATRLIDRSPLRHSMVAHLAWRVYVRRYEARVARLRAAGDAAVADEWGAVEPVRTDRDLAEKQARYLDFYVDTIRYSARIAELAGKPFFHFVQPNQYLRGAKPLSEEERVRFVANRGWFDIVTPAYERLSAASRALRREGIESWFLGPLFAARAETVYSDDCCHFNEHGIALINAVMAEAIRRSGRLATIPVAG